MQDFAASQRYFRAHEAAVLDARARKALICVEEVAVHSLAAEIIAKEDHWLDTEDEWWENDTEQWSRLLEYMR